MCKIIYNYGSKNNVFLLPNKKKSKMNKSLPFIVIVAMCNNLMKSLWKIRLGEDLKPSKKVIKINLIIFKMLFYTIWYG